MDASQCLLCNIISSIYLGNAVQYNVHKYENLCWSMCLDLLTIIYHFLTVVYICSSHLDVNLFLCLIYSQMAEYRISIYGRKQSEWDQLASWIVNNDLYSENVVVRETEKRCWLRGQQPPAQGGKKDQGRKVLFFSYPALVIYMSIYRLIPSNRLYEFLSKSKRNLIEI